jgi:hypothetical protein
MTSITVTLPPETERKLREKAGAAGVTLEVYLRQLAEKDAGNGTPSPPTPTFDEMTGPLAEAVEAAGMSEQELGDFFTEAVKEVRAEKRAGK